jgi:hypothetical protein
LSFSLPYSANRRYLTGIDWIVGALDHSAKNTIGLGGFSQAILDVEGPIDQSHLRAALNQISQRIPLINGRVARDWTNLAPYWKTGKSAEIPLRMCELPEDNAADSERLFDDHINAPFNSRWQHLRCLMVRIGNRRARIGLVFDHRLLDAFGAEGMFRLMDLAWKNQLEEVLPKIKTTEPAHLDHWPRRLKSGQTLNRYLFGLNEKSVCGLNIPSPGLRRRIHFVHDSLTAEESAAIARRAAEEISVPIVLPSAASRAIAAMRQVVPYFPQSGEQCLVFTSTTNRLPGQEWEKLLFNHFSLMAFSTAQNDSRPANEIAVDLRDQLFDQMRSQIPFVMEDAGALGRICPHWIGSRLMNALFSGRFCTFYFACLRETGFAGDSFMGMPVSNLTHKPIAFSPPGLNICMTWFAGHFNLVISYVEGVLSAASARWLMSEFKISLLS